MDVPDRTVSGGVNDRTAAGEPDRLAADAASTSPVTVDAAAWVADLPPPPFVDPASTSTNPRFATISPRVVVLLGAAIFIGVLLWMARDAVRPFILGLLFVYLLDPPVRWLARRGVRRSLAILAVYVVAIVAIIEFLNLTLTPLIQEMVRLVQDLPNLAAQLQVQVDRLAEFYTRLVIPAAIREWIDSMITSITAGGAGGGPSFDPTDLLPILTGATSFLGGIFAYIILPVWVFYILKDRVLLVSQFDRGLPVAWRFDTWAVLKIVRRVFGQWVRAQLILGLSVGLFTFIGLLVLSRFVDPVFGRYAVLLSVIAGILALVPIIGPIISAVPAVLLAATAGLEPVVAALLLYLLVQQTENNLLVPKIQGDAIQLHPALVMFAIVIGGALAGLLGAILALPVTAAIRDVTRYLFRRLSPEANEALAESIGGLGLEVHPGIPGRSSP
jgi:predicted PurR-regulated permease PerM